MPGKLWSAQEKRLLRRQIKAGVPLADVGVLKRTTVGIAYQLRQLKLYPTTRWTNAEVRILRNEAKTGKPPWKIAIPGRSPLSVRNKMLRLQLWKPKCHYQKPWMRTEMNRLKHLVINRGYTALQAVSNGYFTGRSIHSVAQQMRRCGWKRTRRASRVSQVDT
jgi:hypothetical protein